MHQKVKLDRVKHRDIVRSNLAPSSYGYIPSRLRPVLLLPTMTQHSIAQKNWELENNITTLDPEQDSLYYYDADQQRTIGSQQPWKSEYVPHPYESCTQLCSPVTNHFFFYFH